VLSVIESLSGGCFDWDGETGIREMVGSPLVLAFATEGVPDSESRELKEASCPRALIFGLVDGAQDRRLGVSVIGSENGRVVEGSTRARLCTTTIVSNSTSLLLGRLTILFTVRNRL
jgi:hypothetical protein